jgi:hypothetical protein
MNKLTYEIFKSNDSIIIDLHNDYSIVALKRHISEENQYEVGLFLKDNAVDDLYAIEDKAEIRFNATFKTINSAILKTVATLLSDGFFKKYINRINYMMECFNKGDEIFCRERTSDMIAS